MATNSGTGGSTTYCGACVASLAHTPRSCELVCPSCGNIVYSCINIRCDRRDRGRRAPAPHEVCRRTYHITHHALIAGYTEVGETLEECCRREIKEEVGLSVRDLTYVTDQPWSFSDTLLVGFFAKLDGPDELTVDGEELSLAEWVERKDLPTTHEDTSSMTNWMIDLFVRGTPSARRPSLQKSRRYRFRRKSQTRRAPPASSCRNRSSQRDLPRRR
ncbi:NAD(+) diphosphatase [Atopobium sp. oral taxon 416]|uniref:NAD(+) diphosphatase n=1 Tax=Atopobium sp. oral taxon 416 TaxID=712157 RepID=UPI0035301316